MPYTEDPGEEYIEDDGLRLRALQRSGVIEAVLGADGAIEWRGTGRCVASTRWLSTEGIMVS